MKLNVILTQGFKHCFEPPVYANNPTRTKKLFLYGSNVQKDQRYTVAPAKLHPSKLRRYYRGLIWVWSTVKLRDDTKTKVVNISGVNIYDVAPP